MSTSGITATASGHPTFSLAKMAREGLFVDLRAALSKARKQRSPVRKEGVTVQINGAAREVTLEVTPIRGQGTPEQFYLIDGEGHQSTADGKDSKAIDRGSMRFASKLNDLGPFGGSERAGRDIERIFRLALEPSESKPQGASSWCDEFDELQTHLVCDAPDI